MLGPRCKILHNPHYHMLASIPSLFIVSKRYSTLCGSSPPPAVASARPERSGGLLNTRPQHAKFPCGGRNADSYGWDRDSPPAVNIHSAARCLSQNQVIQDMTLPASIQRRRENGSAWMGGVKATLWLTALSFVTLLLLACCVLLNAAISSERNGSKTITNNIDNRRKDQPLRLNKMLDLPVETYIYNMLICNACFWHLFFRYTSFWFSS